MPGHSRSKNGVASLAYVPGIHVFMAGAHSQGVDGRDKPGHDDREVSAGSPTNIGNERYRVTIATAGVR